MAMTPSTMLDLGTDAPDFKLPDTEGNLQTLQSVKGPKGTLVAFICNHCPYVIHIADVFSAMAKEYQSKGIYFVALNSNDTDAYPADSLPNMVKEKQLRQYDFPYLLDATQQVAHAYKAACTPDLYLFDSDLKLVYRGQFDSTRPHRISSGNYDSNKTPATGEDLREALDAVLAEQPPLANQKASLGCNIKWKENNQPSYFG